MVLEDLVFAVLGLVTGLSISRLIKRIPWRKENCSGYNVLAGFYTRNSSNATPGTDQRGLLIPRIENKPIKEK